MKFHFKGLRGAYCRDTDTLTIGNGKMAVSSEEMAKGLTAHYDKMEEVVGFTLKWAGELLLTLLRMRRVSTAEELAAIGEIKATGS